jgi:hypothetical protein
MVHRAFAFTKKGLGEAFSKIMASEKYLPFPRHLETRRRQNIHTVYDKEGRTFWNILEKFVRRFLAVEYRFQLDSNLIDWWRGLQEHSPHLSIPKLSSDPRDASEEVITMICHCITMVTAMHWQVGSDFTDFFALPDQFASKWFENEGESENRKDARAYARPQAAFAASSISAVTTVPGISLIDDWSHLVVGDGPSRVRDARKDAAEQFILDLKDMARRQSRTVQQGLISDRATSAETIKQIARCQEVLPYSYQGLMISQASYHCFNPALLELSVSK